jgi:hypothetical protein
MVFSTHQQLAGLQYETKLATSVFVIFCVEELKGNNLQLTKDFSYG